MVSEMAGGVVCDQAVITINSENRNEIVFFMRFFI